jgi:hypothetical protein
LVFRGRYYETTDYDIARVAQGDHQFGLREQPRHTREKRSWSIVEMNAITNRFIEGGSHKSGNAHCAASRSMGMDSRH